MSFRLFAAAIVATAACCGPLAADEMATVLVYEAVAPEGATGDVSQVQLEQLVAAIGRRLEAGQLKAARVRLGEGKRIVVTIRGTNPDTVTRIARLVESPGTLEFRILANRRDHKSLIERAEKAQDAALADDGGRRLAWWVPVVAGAESTFDNDPQIAARKRKQGDREVFEVLVVEDAFDVTGKYLESVAAGVDSRGQPCLEFSFNARGGKLLGGLTSSNLPDPEHGFARRLGIVLDGRLHSAPRLQSTIQRRGEITGRFSRQEVEDLVLLFRAGSLPLGIKQVSRSEVNLKR